MLAVDQAGVLYCDGDSIWAAGGETDVVAG